jgi:hypothetical protein
MYLHTWQLIVNKIVDETNYIYDLLKKTIFLGTHTDVLHIGISYFNVKKLSALLFLWTPTYSCELTDYVYVCKCLTINDSILMQCLTDSCAWTVACQKSCNYSKYVCITIYRQTGKWPITSILNLDWLRPFWCVALVYFNNNALFSFRTIQTDFKTVPVILIRYVEQCLCKCLG